MLSYAMIQKKNQIWVFALSKQTLRQLKVMIWCWWRSTVQTWDQHPCGPDERSSLILRPHFSPLRGKILQNKRKSLKNDSPTWVITHCTRWSSSWTDISSSLSQHSISGRGPIHSHSDPRSPFTPLLLFLFLSLSPYAQMSLSVNKKILM